jgi:hypothetical protein
LSGSVSRIEVKRIRKKTARATAAFSPVVDAANAGFGEPGLLSKENGGG